MLCFLYANYMLISYYANKKSSPRLPSWQPSFIFFNIPIESGTILKPCTLKHFQVTYMLHKAGYWTTRAPSQYKDRLSMHGYPMLKIRRSRGRLIFNMGIPVMVGHLYINTASSKITLASIAAGLHITWDLVMSICFRLSKLIYDQSYGCIILHTTITKKGRI